MLSLKANDVPLKAMGETTVYWKIESSLLEYLPLSWFEIKHRQKCSHDNLIQLRFNNP
jgi:hypothetical protein